MREFFPEHRLLELAAAVATIVPAVAVAVTVPRAQGGTNFSYVAGDEAGSLIGSSELVPAWLSRVSGQARPAAWWCPIARIPDSRLWVVPRAGQSLSAAQRARLTSLASEQEGLEERTMQLDALLATAQQRLADEARRAEILENRIANLEVRGVEETRRADEATERAARLEARVHALTDELGARSGPPPDSAAGDSHAMERTLIEEALKRTRFNKSKAAKELGLTRHQLYDRIRRYGIGGRT
jgi:hypothetical protein